MALGSIMVILAVTAMLATLAIVLAGTGKPAGGWRKG